MALLKGKLLAGALFAGALFAPPAEQVVVTPVATQQGAGLFKPIRAASAHAVTAHATTRWNLNNPTPVVTLVIPASTQFVTGGGKTHVGVVPGPYIGILTPCIQPRGRIDVSVAAPRAGAGSVFVSGSLFVGSRVLPAASGAAVKCIGSGVFTRGIVLYPNVVKNPTIEMLTLL